MSPEKVVQMDDTPGLSGGHTLTVSGADATVSSNTILLASQGIWLQAGPDESDGRGVGRPGHAIWPDCVVDGGLQESLVQCRYS